MAKYKCTKDIRYGDVLIASEGDIVEVINDTIANPIRGTMYKYEGAINKYLEDGTLEEISSEDKVNHPSHYTWLKEKCGIGVIDITRHLDFDTGNAVKYLLRAGHKSEEGMTDKEKTIQDLKKAAWYINDRIKTIENGN